jgi:hypothetical protein
VNESLLKFSQGNLAYVLNLTQHGPLLTRPRPHSDRSAIDLQNWVRDQESQ